MKTKSQRENIKFITKVMAIHFVTYILCGLIFAKLFNYDELFNLGNAQYFMRDAYGKSSLVGPFVQIIRGLLLGGILFLLKDNFMTKKNSWLYLWIIIAGIGIVCTPGPAPVSIEGLVYSQLPLEFHLKTAPELFTQTLLFSILVTNKRKINIAEKYKLSVVITAIAGVGFSLSGIVLALVIGADVMESATDPFAFIVMAISLAIVFLTTNLLCKKKIGYIFYCLIDYTALAVLPTIYNYLSDSLLKSPLSLIISGLPLAVIIIYLHCYRKKDFNR